MNYLIYCFYFFCFFPYIQILPFETDSQPNAMFIGAILLLLFLGGRKKISVELKLLLATFICSIYILFMYYPITGQGLRLLGGYGSLFLIPYVTTFALRRTNGIPYSFFCFVIFFWFTVGAVQLFVDQGFFQFLLFRDHSNADYIESGRGINALAPEPTFYGIICMFLWMINHLNFRTKKYYHLLAIACMIQLFVFSRSSTCFFILFISLAVFLVFQSVAKSKNKARAVLLVVLGGYLFLLLFSLDFSFLSDYRIGRLLMLLQRDPIAFISEDASVNERFNHMFFSIYGFFRDWGLPHGYDSFQELVREIRNDGEFHSLFIDFFSLKRYSRIMSGIGSLLFELGIIGLIPLYVIIKSFYSLRVIDSSIVFVLILYLMIMLNAFPFTTSIAPFLLGNALFLNEKYQIMNTRKRNQLILSRV